MRPFIKLANRAEYVACPWNLSADAEGRAYWVEFFKRHVNTILKLGVEAAVARDESLDTATQRADACRHDFYAAFDRFIADPSAHGVVTILTLDQWRDRILRDHGFVDAFVDLKDRENTKMLPILLAVWRRSIRWTGGGTLKALIEGVFAGNIFDMGADATAKAFLGRSPDFFNTRATLAKRPWLIDDYDALEARLLNGTPHRKAVYFIDNAGSDFLLGALPMATRWLARKTET